MSGNYGPEKPRTWTFVKRWNIYALSIFITKFKEVSLFHQPLLLTYNITAKYAGNHKLQYIEWHDIDLGGESK